MTGGRGLSNADRRFSCKDNALDGENVLELGNGAAVVQPCECH